MDLDIGGRIYDKSLEWAETEKRRAVMATEEVVKREESSAYEARVTRLRQEFESEKESLREAFQKEQEEAIKRAEAQLTIVLKKEEEENIRLVLAKENKIKQREVQDLKEAWQDEMTKSIMIARAEEQKLARQEAEAMAIRVAEERQVDAERFVQEKENALKDLAEKLQVQWEKAISEAVSREKSAGAKEREILTEDYEEKLSETKGTIWLLEGEVSQLKDKIGMLEVIREQLQTDHNNLKREFADFVNHVPGFRDDFILK